MKTLAVLILAFCSIICKGQQRSFSGIVKESTLDLPACGAQIVNFSDVSRVVLADTAGRFTISAQTGDTLQCSYLGYEKMQLIISDSTHQELIFYLKEADYGLEEVVVGYGGSSMSAWAGATLLYNLDGKSPDNVIGSSKVILNTAKLKSKCFNLNVIGNISKFTGEVDTAAVRKDLMTIVQSSQGLSVGLEPILTIYKGPDADVRTWVTVNYKVNHFKDVEVLSATENITLSQFRLTTGIELEAIRFIDGNNRIHFGIEGSMSVFDSEKYEKIFGESRSRIFAVDWDIIVPLFKGLGFMVTQTFAKGIKPVLSTGIVVGAH